MTGKHKAMTTGGGLMATIASEFFAGPKEQRRPPSRQRSYFPLLAAVVCAVEAVGLWWLMELVG